MTLRELLKDLQTQDEKSLDNPVLVSPASGGTAELATSKPCVGNIVIHLLDAPKLTERGRELQEIINPKK
jgi:hypothetical protein